MLLSDGVLVDRRYQIIRKLGEGGMATVYLAVELTGKRELALKFLQKEHLDSAEQCERFKQEGKMLAAVKHSNLVTLFRIGTWESTPYLAMEYLEGTALDELLDSQKVLSVAQLLNIAIQICDGLEAVHAAGIVHRDLKPANIFLVKSGANDNKVQEQQGASLSGSGKGNEPQEAKKNELSASKKFSVKILDLGLARIVPTNNEQSGHLTGTGAVVGTVYYMSPEQCIGQKADARSDIYSLGCIAYKALSGSVPFEGDTSVAVMQHHVSSPVPRLKPGLVPPGLEKVLFKAMAKHADDRYQSAAELKRDLELVASNRDSEIQGLPVALPPHSKKENPIPGVILFCGSLVALSCLYKQSFGPGTVELDSRPQSKLQSKLQTDPRIVLRRVSKSIGRLGGSDLPSTMNELRALEAETEHAINRIPTGNAVLLLQARVVKGGIYRLMRVIAPSPDLEQAEAAEYESAIQIIRDRAGRDTQQEGIIHGFTAELWLQSGKLKRATECYKKAVLLMAKEPSDKLTLDDSLPGSTPVGGAAHYRLGLGQCALAAKDYARSIEYLNTCIKELPAWTGDGLVSRRTLMVALHRAGQKETLQRFVQDMERKNKREFANHDLTQDQYVSIESVIVVGAAKARGLDKAIPMAEEVLAMMDLTTAPVYLRNVSLSLDELQALAEAQHRRDLMDRISKMQARLLYLQESKS
jgi:serine/threonine protein kinase